MCVGGGVRACVRACVCVYVCIFQGSIYDNASVSRASRSTAYTDMSLKIEKVNQLMYVNK